jgi:hypothetical protein
MNRAARSARHGWPRAATRYRLVLCRALAWAFAIIAIASWTGPGQAQDPQGDLEQRVKAAFLYQFAAYVEWPPAAFANADAPVTIGIVSADALADELEKMVVGRTVAGRLVAVKRLRAGELPAAVHILFVGGADAGRLSKIARGGQPVLTVTESDGALAHGSMINFVLVDRRVRFEVALDTAQKSGLRLSSRLLAVAQDVRKGAR